MALINEGGFYEQHFTAVMSMVTPIIRHYHNVNLRITRSSARQHLTVIAALLAMLGPFTIDTYLPSFPDIESTFAISRAVLSQSLGVYLIAFAISTLLWGPLADRIGRRPVILISLALYAIASIGCALVNDFHSFLLLRILQGLAASGGLIAGRAMIRDAHDADSAHKAMAQVMFLFALAPAIAPILGGWLHDHFGWHSIFWFLTGFAILLMLLVAFISETLPDSLRQSFHPRAVSQVYWRAIMNRHFLGLVFAMSFSFAGLFLYIAGAPIIIYDFLGLGSDDFGLQFIPMVAGIMLGTLVSTRMIHQYTVQRIITTGLGVMFVAVIINLVQASIFAPHIILIIAPLAIYALGMAMVMPALTVLALDCFPHHRGSAASIQGFLQMLISAAVASIAVPMLQGEQLYFALGQGLSLTIALTLWLSITLRRS